MPAPTYTIPTAGQNRAQQETFVRTALTDLKTLLTSGITRSNLASSAIPQVGYFQGSGTGDVGITTPYFDAPAAVTMTVSGVSPVYVIADLAIGVWSGISDVALVLLTVDGSEVARNRFPINSTSAEVPTTLHRTFAPAQVPAGTHTFGYRIQPESGTAGTRMILANSAGRVPRFTVFEIA